MFNEVSYSENGGPTTTERSTMQYSTDPTDFTEISLDSNSKTSTVERKNSRGGIYSITKLEKIQDDKKVASMPRIIRRGSVKELKEKFVRKDSSSSVKSQKRSSVERETSSSTSKFTKESKSSSETKSFLNSEKKASNVHEIMDMMRNADNGMF